VTDFIAHNIVLPDGTQTLPGVTPVAETGICRAALGYLAAEFPDPAGVTVADLGCLEGGYAAEFARAGYTVTGVDARAENLECAARAAAALGLGNLSFELADVRGLDGEWDAVFCCGLLYHLDEPAAFLRLLGKVTRRLLIVQSHYSLTGGAVNEGYEGHWYPEPGDRQSSYGNRHSFWLRKECLLDAMGAAGFDAAERDDYRAEGGFYRDMFGIQEAPDRGMFTGVRR
jgi:SAM-dependent methyltransferase